MYKRLTAALLYTREDFTSVCNQLGINAAKADPAMLDAVMCDSCGFWESPSKAHVSDDDTVLCKACHELEDMRF